MVFVVFASLGLGLIESLAECSMKDLVYLYSVLDRQILEGLSSLNG